jgi:hypothetical protein
MTVSVTADVDSTLNGPPADSKERVVQFLRSLQDSICQKLTEVDGGGTFKQDEWERPEGGGGRSRVMMGGDLFEQGGVNFSEVWGDHLPPSILNQRPQAAGHRWFATGTSMVLHPRSPYIPTIHLNYRYFEAGPVWWFGGGIDLTPYYPFLEDVVHFHNTLKEACDRHSPNYYPTFKRWCDEYFYLKHRQVSAVFSLTTKTAWVVCTKAPILKAQRGCTVPRLGCHPSALGRSYLPLSKPVETGFCPPMSPLPRSVAIKNTERRSAISSSIDGAAM